MMVDREWILLNPGPANTTPTVRQALVMPDLCHREPECFEMLRRCRERLVRLAGGGHEFAAVLFGGSGTAAVEAAICSAVPRDGAFVLGRRGALDALKGATPRSVYLDVYGHFASQEADNTPFTPPVQVLHAMEQALVELEREGVLNRLARYADNARVLRDGMTRLGFEILVPPPVRSNILTTFRLLPGVAYDPLHDAMKRRGYVIYGGQGDIRTYAFRVSNMGTLAPRDMEQVVAAFAGCLDELGVTVVSRR